MKESAVQLPEVSATIQSIRNALMRSQEALAKILGLSVRTVVRWEKEGVEPPPLEGERLDLIHEVIEIAKDIMEPEDIVTWFSKPKDSALKHIVITVIIAACSDVAGVAMERYCGKWVF